MFESHTWTSNSTNGEGINGYIMEALVLQKAVMELFRVAEVVRGHGGPRRKVWTRTKILSPNICYFVAN